MTREQLIQDAEQLAARLAEDIPLCRTRDEHIRVTARANEAANLLDGLRNMEVPLYQFESSTFTVTDDLRDGTVNA
jgi:hypothetical protein